MNSPYYSDHWVTIYHGDCIEVLPILDKASAIVTDPPYELGFMGKSWDSKGISFQKETWQIIRDSCFPGAMLLSFGGTRTFHRITCAIEDAGWEIRDTVMWVYGSGFPKSLDISKAIDKQAGVEREVVGHRSNVYPDSDNWGKESDLSNGFHKQYVAGEPKEKKHGQTPIEKPTTLEAQLWQGYGTALKPAYEPIIVAMNPLDGTFAQNALKHGVAGLNIDECRIGVSKNVPASGAKIQLGSAWTKLNPNAVGDGFNSNIGRFPANFIHDGSQVVMELFPNSKSPATYTRKSSGFNKNSYGKGMGQESGIESLNYGDNGSAARFFKKCELSLIDLCLSQSYDTMSICKNIYVNTAENLLGIIQATIENTARLNVEDWQGVQNDPLVRSAVNHADTCEILTALVLVRIKNLASSKEILQAIRDYTSNSKECTQLLNLVSSVEIQASIDITQITISLLKSFGYVNPATINYTPKTERLEPKRFLYTPKASKSERNKGCEDIEPQNLAESNKWTDVDYRKGNGEVTAKPQHNSHPTVKPLALMEYLVKLVKMPEYNLIIDPFMGSGTTLLACIRLGIPCIGIDNDEKSCEIAARRCSQAIMELKI